MNNSSPISTAAKHDVTAQLRTAARCENPAASGVILKCTFRHQAEPICIGSPKLNHRFQKRRLLNDGSDIYCGFALHNRFHLSDLRGAVQHHEQGGFDMINTAKKEPASVLF